MTTLLLSPHNDDEALSASYIALRERPKVIVVLLGARKKDYADPVERVAESAAAMDLLGCEFEQLWFPIDQGVDWELVEMRLRAEPVPDRVWVPVPEPGGHSHHNKLARVAAEIWPGRLSYFSTYRVNEAGWPIRTTHGQPIEEHAHWPALKRQALDCYQTQIQRSGTAMHFEQPLDEYEMPSLRLNLGGALNPISGFVNLGKETGWTFESGLGDYASGSVEAITESHALMYVELEQWPFVFGEFARVLEPGGTIRLTHDWIGGPGSGRREIRPGAALATTPDVVLEHLAAAGLAARLVDQDDTGFVDRSLIQQNYGREPDVFHVEATKES